MKRLSTLLASLALVLAVGCGFKGYEDRLDRTLEELRYRIRLDKALDPAPADAKFKEFQLYIRPPKGMALSTQFVPAELPAGQYDLAASFIAQDKGGLHVLGRRKSAPKKASKNAPAPPEPVARGAFQSDVMQLLTVVYGDNEKLTAPKFQNETKRANKFKMLVFTAPNNNVIRVYLYQQPPYDLALIFDTPAAAERNTELRTARELCLESMAVGSRARLLSEGGTPDAEAEGGKGGGGSEEPATPF